MKKEKVFWGLLFILGGIFLIVSKLGFFPDVNIFSLLLSVFLGAVIVKSLLRLNYAGILFPAAFICIIYDEQLGITAITPWTILIAALLGSIGLSMIFSKRIEYIHKKNWDFKEFEKIDIEDGSHTRHSTSFGSSMKYVNTNQFVQADFKCSFGAMKVFFDNAIMQNDHGIVHIDASFSGMELYIPKNWKIEDKTNVAFGSIEEKNKAWNETTHTLTLVGNVNFSGIEIIYV